MREWQMCNFYLLETTFGDSFQLVIFYKLQKL